MPTPTAIPVISTLNPLAVLTNTARKSVRLERITPDLINKALKQFVKTYLIPCGAGFRLNTVAFQNIDSDPAIKAKTIHRLGRALRKAMVISKSHLPFHLPLSVLAALTDTEPTIPDLEHFLGLFFPEIVNLVLPLRDNLAALGTYGYNSYIECLETFAHNPDPNSEEHTISRILAKGLTDGEPIPNLASMNLPALDTFFTKRLIDRKRFIKKLRGPPRAVRYMEDLINSAMDFQLEDLLVNWSDCPVLRSGYYYNVQVRDDDSITFYTCVAIISIPSACIERHVGMVSIGHINMLIVEPF